MREAAAQAIRHRVQREILPLMTDIRVQRLAMNDLLEAKLADPRLARPDKKILTDLLFYNCDLLEQAFGEDMSELRRKYLTKAQLKRQEKLEAEAEAFEAAFGNAFGGGQPDTDHDAPPAEDAPPPRKRGRPAKAPPIDPAVKRKVDLQRFMRSLYLALVKNIHPDLERDPDKQRFRTDLMQRVTRAYQALDLYELLRAKRELIELEASDYQETTPETEQAEITQLRQYITLLKSQRSELEQENFMREVSSPDSRLMREFYRPGQPKATDKAFDREKKKIRAMLDTIATARNMLNDEYQVVSYLRMLSELNDLDGYF